jgi:hypothetical protein
MKTAEERAKNLLHKLLLQSTPGFNIRKNCQSHPLEKSMKAWGWWMYDDEENYWQFIVAPTIPDDENANCVMEQLYAEWAMVLGLLD